MRRGAHSHDGATVRPVACNRDCGGGCPLLATVEDGRVRRIADNPAGGPYLKGCIRGYHAWRQQQAPDRLTSPLVRTGPRGSGQFREAGWPEAVCPWSPTALRRARAARRRRRFWRSAVPGSAAAPSTTPRISRPGF